MRKRKDGRWEACLDSPEATAALEFYKKLRWTKWERDGKQYTGVVRTAFGGTTGSTYDRMFARGEVAMAIMPLLQLQWVLDRSMVRPDAIGVAPLPAGPAGRASIIDGEFYAINSAIMNDKRKMDAAWEYIRFFTSDRAKEIETKTYVETGYGRFVRNPHWLEQFGYKEYFDEIDPQQLAAYDEALKYGHPEPFCPNYAAMGGEMDIPISKVLRDPNTDPAAELKEINKRINTSTSSCTPRTRCASGARSSRWAGWVSWASWASSGTCSSSRFRSASQAREATWRWRSRHRGGSTSTRGYSWCRRC